MKKQPKGPPETPERPDESEIQMPDILDPDEREEMQERIRKYPGRKQPPTR